MTHENILNEDQFGSFYMNAIRLALGNSEIMTPLSENVEKVLNAIKTTNNPALFLPKAAQLGCFDVVRFILDNNLSNTNDKDQEDNDALHYVMQSGLYSMFSGTMLEYKEMLEMVTFLCERGADKKQEALKCASQNGYVSIAKYLIQEQHADPFASNDESSLSLLVKAFNFITGKIVYIDQSHPISLEDARDVYKSTYEESAYKAFEILDLVKELLSSMPQDELHTNVSSLLKIATQNAPGVSTHQTQGYPVNEFFNMVDLLLEFGADINSSLDESTAFQAAILLGGRQMVAHLLDKGAELHKGGKGIFEESAYSLAMRHGRPDIKDIILNHLETHPDDQGAINSAAGDFLQQDEFMELAGDNTQISHMPDEPAA